MSFDFVRSDPGQRMLLQAGPKPVASLAPRHTPARGGRTCHPLNIMLLGLHSTAFQSFPDSYQLTVTAPKKQLLCHDQKLIFR
jgi:hypothetical protein